MRRKIGGLAIGLVISWAGTAQGQAFKVDGGSSAAAEFTSVETSGGPLDEGVVVYALVGPHTQEVDTIAVWGDSNPRAGYGIGGYFNGGSTGVEGSAGGDETGSGYRVGLSGWAWGGESAYGVRGEATAQNEQAKSAYGLWGIANCDNGADCAKRAVFASGDIEHTGALIGPTSDLRFKESLARLESAVPKLMELEVVSFEYIQSEEVALLHLPQGPRVGFVAQQVADVLPELVVESVHPGVIDRRDKSVQAEPIRYLSLKPLELIPYLVRAIQEQQAQIEALEAELRPLRTRLAELEPDAGKDEVQLPAAF